MVPIAYIAGQFPLRSETFVWREVRELMRRGWDVHTFALHRSTEVTPPELIDLRDTTRIVYDHEMGSAFASLPGLWDAATHANGTPARDRLKLAMQARAGAALARELRRRGVRHIHAHFAHAPTSVAMYAARAAGIGFSFMGHANDLFQRRQALSLKLRRSRFVACISKWHRELYRSLVSGDESKYPIIHCGVDTDHWTLPHVAQTLDPQTADSPTRLLTVARLVPKKGIDYLVRAVARLHQTGRRVPLTIAGEGPERGRIEALVRECSLADHVKLLGATESEDVLQLMHTHDIFALPCVIDPAGDRDGVPVSLMEAMACGLPVVSGDLPAVRELVSQESGGILVDGTDVEAIATSIASLIDQPDRRKSLGQLGRAHVVREFSLAANVTRLEAAFDAALKGD